MKKFVLSSDTLPSECQCSLISLGYTPLLLPKCQRLQDGVASHSDMLVFFFGKKYLCTKEYYFQAKDIFEQINALGYAPIFTDEIHGKDYPSDVLFNALPLGKHIYGLSSALSKDLTNLANMNGMEIVNVRQGYTKCSVCKVSENAIITADTGIAKAAQEREADVLKISAGHVRLDGYDCGFIGGASGADEKSVFFCGDILSHPDGEAIIDFCAKHGKACISLSNEPLFDVGTLFFL